MMAFTAGAAVSNVYCTQPLLDRQRSGDRPSQTRPRAGGDVGRACARDSPPPSAEGDKLPMRPIDILRDLGMYIRGHDRHVSLALAVGGIIDNSAMNRPQSRR